MAVLSKIKSQKWQRGIFGRGCIFGEKTLKKLSEIKSVMNRIEAKPLQINTHDDCKYYPETEDDIIFRP